MERLGDRRLAGMSYAQAGVHVCVCVSVSACAYACLLYTRVSSVYHIRSYACVYDVYVCVCDECEKDQ